MMFYNGLGRGFGCGGFGMFHSFWGIGLTLVIVGLIFFMLMRNKNTSGKSTKNALYELDMRFASGEISEEEYTSRKNVLKNK